MNRLVAYLTGESRVSVTGASPQDLLNQLSLLGIPFWDTERCDEVHYRFSVSIRDEKKVYKAALRCFCSTETDSRKGVPVLMKKLRGRLALLIGMLAAIALCFLLQNRIWVLEVHGNVNVPTDVILHELAALNIKPGADASDYDPQQIKMKMLNAVPELSWLAANRTGGKITVLVTERSTVEENRERPSVGNIIAAADGIITDYSISEGMRLCDRGDTVTKGQIIVSGYEDYGLCLRAVCANAEIYAKTWHKGSIITPATKKLKEYTGREWVQRSVLFGRKRINLSGNSRISIDSCDKMIFVKKLRIPGYEFPIAIETAVYREYTLREQQRLPAVVQGELQEAWQSRMLDEMVAGQIDDTQFRFFQDQSVYVLQAESVCNEMIARLVPIYGQNEGELHD